MKSVKRSTWPEALSTISGVTAGHSTCTQCQGVEQHGSMMGRSSKHHSMLTQHHCAFTLLLQSADPPPPTLPHPPTSSMFSSSTKWLRHVWVTFCFMAQPGGP